MFPPYYFNSPIKVYLPTNPRKNFVPTKLWQIFKWSPPLPPILCGWGRNHGLNVSEIQGLSSRIFWSSFDWPRKDQSLSQLGVTHCFWTCEPYIENPIPKPLGPCLWSKSSWCYISFLDNKLFLQSSINMQASTRSIFISFNHS